MPAPAASEAVTSHISKELKYIAPRRAKLYHGSKKAMLG
jgi:hypothetical protein